MTDKPLTLAEAVETIRRLWPEVTGLPEPDNTWPPDDDDRAAPRYDWHYLVGAVTAYGDGVSYVEFADGEMRPDELIVAGLALLAAAIRAETMTRENQ